MSRKRRDASSPVQLFPFLAVLVSAMGALVLLLLSINRQATLQAIAKSVAELMQRTSSEEESLARNRQALQREIDALQR